MRLFGAAAVCLFVGTASFAEDYSQEAHDFAESGMIATFYHELGHAFIDVLGLPVLGQEEDAADVLSVVLTHQLWEEEYAQQVAWATAASYKISAMQAEDEGWETAWWDVHGSDLQRHYTHVCLFYGGNPSEREGFVVEFELPEDRALGCEDEYALAEASWDVHLDEIDLGLGAKPTRKKMSLEVAFEDQVSEALIAEVEALNETFALPTNITVYYDECGEPNAFYVPDDDVIIMCTELTAYLLEQAASIGM